MLDWGSRGEKSLQKSRTHAGVEFAYAKTSTTLTKMTQTVKEAHFNKELETSFSL